MAGVDLARPFTVGPWQVRADSNEIAADGTVVRLEPKAMQLLALLAARPGHTVSRAALVAALWDGRTVTDDAINRQVAKLREALGDDPRSPSFIRTIPRTGLQLIAPVVQDGRDAGGPKARPRRRPLLAAAAGAAVVSLGAAALLLADGGARLGPETRLTSDVGAEIDPALSPDGRRLAFAGEQGDQRVMVRALDDPHAPPLSARGTTARAPAWSPSGRQLAFVQSAPSCAVMIGSPAALTSRVAWACPGWTVGRLAWRDDGRLILSASRDHAPYQLLMLDLASGRLTPLSHPPEAGLGDVNPLWVEAERRLYFVRTGRGGLADSDLFTLDPATGATGQVTRVGGWFNELAPGGPHALTMVATRGESLFRVWRLDLRDGRWTPLTGAGDFIGLAASADGRTLVFGKASGSISLVAADSAGTGPERVMTTSTAMDWRPALCGDRFAFLSSRSGSVQLWSMARTGEPAPAQLTRIEGSLAEFACSGDGGLFALGVNRGGRRDLVLFNRRTGALDPLAAGGQGLNAPAFSAKGDAVYFVRQAAGRPTLVRHDLATNAESQVARDVVRALAAPDGSALYLVRADRRSLWRLDLAAGGERRLAVLPVTFAPMDLVVGDGVLWVLGRPGPRHGAPLYRIDARTGAVEPVRRLPDLFGDNFGLAADGARLVYPRLDRLDVDLYRAEVARAWPWDRPRR